ncbi:hypothetical protein [Paenilisteria rocourtiae]|uniref:Uncharacterized protein n=1 Tax=Listeria rocourtiae TaxID=647910 RepID=A0A4R6ZKR6_9LIST|nr:hypothetical protein [Listeria rocourtiae]EUJ51050.1 hypothetical protein PROCOU_03039 [Listeria rocourtiae FSL F6-920]TDR52918.1 hypothetical protein DFP96_106125 [Listeria rocourtiae]
MERYVSKSATQKNGASLAEVVNLELELGAQFSSQYRERVQLVNASEFGEWSLANGVWDKTLGEIKIALPLLG